jgi:hypothetical protein
MFLDQVAAIDLVREMMISTGEEVEVRKYKRLTELIIEVTLWCIFFLVSLVNNVLVQFVLLLRIGNVLMLARI